MKTKLGFLIVLGLVVWACEGTETQNPGALSATFSDSGCKKENGLDGSATGSGQALVSADYSVATAGYDCVAWEVTSARRLKIAFYNQRGACGAEWTGKAATPENGELRLTIENPECKIAKCGSCLFDWSFELDEIDTTRDLDVTRSVEACPGTIDSEVATFALPLSSANRGIRCTYADHAALLAQATQLGTCGAQGMPCNSECSGSDAAAPECAGELTCVEASAATRICAKPCQSDLDCDALGVSVCSDGICRPKSN
ncbi:MAG: hypothetical protein QM784_20005 [Polyangiaceae bacterium]